MSTPSPALAARLGLDDLPGPRGLPLLGNIHQLDFHRIHVALEDWARTFGPIYSVGFGRQRVVVVSDPALMRTMLRERPDKFRRFRAVGRVMEELGLTSLFSTEGQTWQRQRRVYMGALNFHQTRAFFARLVEITRRLRGRWQRAARDGAEVDVLADLMKYTLDVTNRFAFGYDANTLEGAHDEIQERLARLLPVVARRTAAPFPYWHYLKLPSDVGLERDLKALEGYVWRLIDDARRRMAAQPELSDQPSNLVEALIASRDADGSVFSDQEIYANALGTLVAGEDTTATTIAWMLYFTASHAQVQQELHEQVDGVLGASRVWEQAADGGRLRYVDALMSETFRFRPVAPAIFLCTNTEVELGGYTLPAGTDVLAMVRVSAMTDAEFADAQSFDPGRWLVPHPPNFATHPPLPFGSGPRMCPGRNLAQLEIKSAMAMVGRNFQVALAGTAPVREKFSFTLMPENLRIRFTERAG